MKAPKPELPPAFVDFCRRYFQSAQFSSVRRFRAGLIFRWVLWGDGHPSNALPGYAECPPAGKNGFPRGWTLEALGAIAREARSTDTVRRARRSSLITAH